MTIRKLLASLVCAGIATLTAPISTTEMNVTPTTEDVTLPTETNVTSMSHNYYPTTGIVTELETETDSVIYVDFNGNLWDFPGIEDWVVGDRVALIMDNMGTPESIYDDEPVTWRYCGWEY